MFYEVTIAEMRSTIMERFPSITARESFLPGDEVAHLLWMATQIENMMSCSLKDATKAARWIGWMLGKCGDLGFWDNTHSQYLAREDVRLKNDLPR
jgi:hypothetical protein